MAIETTVRNIAYGIIGVVLVFYLVGGLTGTFKDGLSQLSGSGLPLASLFSSTGLMPTIFMAVVLLLAITLLFSLTSGSK